MSLFLSILITIFLVSVLLSLVYMLICFIFEKKYKNISSNEEKTKADEQIEQKQEE